MQIHRGSGQKKKHTDKPCAFFDQRCLVVCCSVGRIAIAVHYIADGTGGALAHAQAAVGALLGIDGCNIVAYSDCASPGRFFSQFAAGNTAHAAGPDG